MVLALITDMVSIYIVTSVSFAAVSYYGTALNNVAASPCGVRPRLTSVSFTTVDYNGSASYRNINTANGVQPFISESFAYVFYFGNTRNADAAITRGVHLVFGAFCSCASP